MYVGALWLVLSFHKKIKPIITTEISKMQRTQHGLTNIQERLCDHATTVRKETEVFNSPFLYHRRKGLALNSLHTLAPHQSLTLKV
jgi:hypothetical protein